MSPIRHKFLCGATRSGKSEGAYSINADDLELRSHNRPAYFVPDIHGSIGPKFGAAAVRHGIPLIYDYLRETGNCPGYEINTPSTNPDPPEREAENRETVNGTKAVLIRSRKLLTTAANPIINEGLNAALNLHIHQKTPVHFSALRDCFFHATDAHDYLKSHCTDFRWQMQFEIYAALRGQAYEFRCGPAERILREVCDSPQFRARCVPTFDMVNFFNGGGMLVLDGTSHGNLSREDTDLIMGLVLLNVIRYARSRRLTRKLVCILDEGQSSTLLDLNVARALQESAKWNLEWQIIAHSPFFS